MTHLFLLHHTREGRIGLCAQEDDPGLGDNAIIARLSLEQTVGLYDDIHESFESSVRRRGLRHPDDGEGDDEPHDG